MHWIVNLRKNSLTNSTSNCVTSSWPSSSSNCFGISTLDRKKFKIFYSINLHMDMIKCALHQLLCSHNGLPPYDPMLRSTATMEGLAEYLSWSSTNPVNISCGRKPECLEKTYDFRQSVDHWFLYNWIAHPTAKMKPQKITNHHEFGVPRWPPQDFRLTETMATSDQQNLPTCNDTPGFKPFTLSDQTIMTKPAKHTGPGVPRWRWWLQNFDCWSYGMSNPVI